MKNSTKKKTQEEVILNAQKVHGNRYDYSLLDYNNNSTKITIICKDHGPFDQLPTAHINQKQDCPKCKGRGKTNNEKIIDAQKVHGYRYDYSLFNFIKSKEKVTIICKDHGQFKLLYDNHIRKKYGCPNCNNSKGEIKINEILIKNNIKYESQKSFNGCKFKQKLKFDFYLPDYNTCIEFDGEQHFSKYRFELNDDKFNIRKERDKIKNDYCLNNNIKLLRIKYTENIEDILNNIF